MKTTLEKVPKLNLNDCSNLIKIPNIESPVTTRQKIYDIKEKTEHFIVDNQTIYNKLEELQNEIKDLRNIINSLYFPKPVKYNYPSCSSYSPNTIYCTPPLESHLIKNYIRK